MNRKYLIWLSVLVGMLCMVYCTPADARPSMKNGTEVIGQTFDSVSGDFTLYVKSDVPWVVWRTFDFETWEQVSPVRGVGIKEWTDVGAFYKYKVAFYAVCSKGKLPGGGNHYGWINSKYWYPRD